MKRVSEKQIFLLNEIKENNMKLDGCKRHRFEFDGIPVIGSKLTCKKCGGKMDTVQAYRYCQGYKAAGGNPNDVIKNFE